MELDLASAEGGTLVERVVSAVLRRIASRDLAPGMRLPSIRRLAAGNAISKSTVVEAYDRLVAEGHLRSRRNAGFYVAGRPAAPLVLAETGAPGLRDIDPLWIIRQSLDAGPAHLRPGCGWLPDSWLDADGIRRALRGLARGADAPLLGYDQPLGYLPLRQQLHLRLAERGVAVDPRHILLTDSASQAIDLVNRFLLQPGDTVLVDDPCYFNVLANLKAHRAHVVGIAYTPQGPDLESFAAAAARHRPRLYITTAALHNPTGASLSAATAHRLLGLAEDYGVTIVEDDIFADFETRPAPRLAAMDRLDRVIHIGSFSKTLSAAIRCGYIAASPDRIEALTDLKLASGFASSAVSAQIVHRLLIDGRYRKHTEAIRDRLARAMIETRRHLHGLGLAIWGDPQAGLFLWARLPEGIDAADLARRALARGIVLAPGNVFSVSRTAGSFLRFNVAQSGHQHLHEVLRDLLSA